jgi:hypothetical protein
MAVQTHPNKFFSARLAIINKSAIFVERHKLRRCMVVSMGLVLAGLSISFLMAIELLPVTLLLNFVGFALTASGGLMSLIFWGEI